MKLYELRFSYQSPNNKYRLNGHTFVLAHDIIEAIEFAEDGKPEFECHQCSFRSSDVMITGSVASLLAEGDDL